MNIGINGSWVELQHKIPFKKCYFYWDSVDQLLATVAFKNQKCSVHYLKSSIVDPAYPQIQGYFITCWKKDSKIIENILNQAYLILKKDKQLQYDYFLSLWHQDLLNLTKV